MERKGVKVERERMLEREGVEWGERERVRVERNGKREKGL